MAWDLVSELRQLSSDITTRQQVDAIKAKHPAILDAAAREIVLLRQELARLRQHLGTTIEMKTRGE